MEVFVVIKDWLSGDNDAEFEIEKIFTDGDKANRYRQSRVDEIVSNIYKGEIPWAKADSYEVNYSKYSDSIEISDKYSYDSLLFTIEKHIVEQKPINEEELDKFAKSYDIPIYGDGCAYSDDDWDEIQYWVEESYKAGYRKAKGK